MGILADIHQILVTTQENFGSVKTDMAVAPAFHILCYPLIGKVMGDNSFDGKLSLLRILMQYLALMN